MATIYVWENMIDTGEDCEWFLHLLYLCAAGLGATSEDKGEGGLLSMELELLPHEGVWAGLVS